MPSLSKQKGNIGEAKCLAKMVELRVPVSLPFGDNERYDMIIEHNNKLEKIQVKYSSEKTENNSIVFHTSSSTNHTTNKHYSNYVNDIDDFLMYNGLNEDIYYFPIEVIGNKKTITTRMGPPKNNQTKGCLFSQDYLVEKFFN